jgi:hypothetical protein
VGDHSALLRATEIDWYAVAMHLNRAEHVHREHARHLAQRPHHEPPPAEFGVFACKPVVRASQAGSRTMVA